VRRRMSERVEQASVLLESPLVETNLLIVGPRRPTEPVNQPQGYKRRRIRGIWRGIQADGACVRPISAGYHRPGLQKLLK
jgi:hypothetical protein